MTRASSRSAVLEIEPAKPDFLTETIEGLSSNPRTLPCKFFYDERGSALFGQICELPEYYITRTELAILDCNCAEIASVFGSGVELIGLGTGAGTKTRLLLENLKDPVAYIPVDISNEQLQRSTALFQDKFPNLEILPVCADYLQPFELPSPSREPVRKVVYFPGSTIGNFEPEAATEFLGRISRFCGKGGGLLIGVDLQKDPQVIERAYNDSANVTARFNLNLLARANRELGADFVLDCWRHRAIYNSAEGRIEMHLISATEQTVHIDGQPFAFRAGESIITEYSHKYTQEGFSLRAHEAGFEFQRLWTDDARLFGLFYFTVKL